MSKGLSKNQLAILEWMNRHPQTAATVPRLLGVEPIYEQNELKYDKAIDALPPSLLRALYSLERRGLVTRLGIGGGHHQRWRKRIG